MDNLRGTRRVERMLAFVAGVAYLAIAPAKAALSAPTEIVLWSFGGLKDGSFPRAGLIADATGALDGTTSDGGPKNAGTVFRLTPSKRGYEESVIWNFGRSGDGAEPIAGLVADSTGALYGTTEAGGKYGVGTAFKLTPHPRKKYTETVLWSFSNASGAYPAAGLIVGAAGALYGTTEEGGAYNAGTVFMLSPAEHGYVETVLWNFCPGRSLCPDGADPVAGLMADSSGDLYGTTKSGGGYVDKGTVFKLTRSGSRYTESVLVSFCSAGSTCLDGASPIGALIADATGTLYGTTYLGGSNGTSGGLAFKLSPRGKKGYAETVIWNFGGPGDGKNPTAGLIADATGALYGTTETGGAYGSVSGGGTVFELAPRKKTYAETVLWSFAGPGDGEGPNADLMRDQAGALYGTTESGGANDRGSVFKVTP
jgi:uncharacterized repeat protein (TIGR03803 family)